MRRNWVKITLSVGLILTPILYWLLGRSLPARATLATGPSSGLYMEIMDDVRGELRRRGVEVLREETHGSIENLRRLQAGEVDFCLYQTGTVDFMADRWIAEHDADGDGGVDRGAEFEALRRDPAFADLRDAPDFEALDRDEDGVLGTSELVDLSGVCFVANTHYDVAHLIVRRAIRGRSIDGVADVVALAEARPLAFSVGALPSGDYAVSRVLLGAIGLEGRVEPRHLSYEETERELLDPDGSIDGALIMAGDRADVLERLLGEGRCRLLPVRHAPALARRNILLEPYTIEAGFYRSGHEPVPAESVPTVALRAQLLTREDVGANLVSEVTRVVRRLAFVERNQLRDLFDGGDEFARRHAEFPLHRGAEDVYDPDLHPFLPTEFVESTEGIRSFVVSFVIALFLAVRWIKERQQKRTEHRLDRYIRALLAIERRQKPLDQSTGSSDLDQLQALLDEVTDLRQEALGEISAHDLNEDRGAACFVDMCHELSEKINAKLTRQTIERQFDRIVAAIATERRPSEEP